ncbi:Replication factor A [Vigna unguiculata]|uniref:Replication factor A n=1 Tax=Vigna unguiculata TaxID=3917 RepID=A0A4D6MRH9_VIGUN|nr:Replication factor A [Vigna unguiculata]
MENNFNQEQVVNRMSRYQFCIIHLEDEVVRFVDRAFAILYDHDLQRQWTLTDEEGNRHVVTYNRNLQKPMINMSLSEVQKQTQNVSQVTPEKENWNIIVRVIRSWFVPDFTKQRCPFSMELVIQDKEVATFILFGTINHIWDEDDWWYTACVCNKAVYPDSKMFFCEKCNKHVIKVFPRYRIKVRVIDSSDSTTFVLFDRDATTLFKKTCADMLESHDKMNGCGNFPKEFEELVNKSLLFKVESRNDQTFKLEQSFRVKKVCLDDDIIEKFNDSSLKSVDVYAGNGEFSREKQRVVNESTVDIAEDLLVRFTKETIECASQSPDLIKDTATNEDGNTSLKRESAKKTLSLESIEEDTVPLKLLKRNIKKEKIVKQ